MTNATESPPSTSNALDTAPCFCCANTRAVPAGRWWILPAISHHVRCLDCGQTYNANTGDSNAPTFFLYFTFLLVGLAAGTVIFYFRHHL